MTFIPTNSQVCGREVGVATHARSLKGRRIIAGGSRLQSLQACAAVVLLSDQPASLICCVRNGSQVRDYDPVFLLSLLLLLLQPPPLLLLLLLPLLFVWCHHLSQLLIHFLFQSLTDRTMSLFFVCCYFCGYFCFVILYTSRSV